MAPNRRIDRDLTGGGTHWRVALWLIVLGLLAGQTAYGQNAPLVEVLGLGEAQPPGHWRCHVGWRHQTLPASAAGAQEPLASALAGARLSDWVVDASLWVAPGAQLGAQATARTIVLGGRSTRRLADPRLIAQLGAPWHRLWLGLQVGWQLPAGSATTVGPAPGVAPWTRGTGAGDWALGTRLTLADRGPAVALHGKVYHRPGVEPPAASAARPFPERWPLAALVGEAPPVAGAIVGFTVARPGGSVFAFLDWPRPSSGDLIDAVEVPRRIVPGLTLGLADQWTVDAALSVYFPSDRGATAWPAEDVGPEWEVALGLSWSGVAWGADSDGDGVLDSVDRCPEVAEDRDGFEDADGCPEADNDGDGIEDLVDGCPEVPEDLDGFEDTDGCPETDNDGDGLPDARDDCPSLAEDLDGHADDDGCPDPDNDADGIRDAVDACPNAPETWNGIDDADGCPDGPERPPISGPTSSAVHHLGSLPSTGS